MARSAHALEVLKVIEDTSNHVYPTNTIDTVHVVNLGTSTLNGVYERLNAYIIPLGFRKVCKEQGWDTKKMWKQLNGDTNSWYKVKTWACPLCRRLTTLTCLSQHTENGSYIYFNQGDRKWWMDGENNTKISAKKSTYMTYFFISLYRFRWQRRLHCRERASPCTTCSRVAALVERQNRRTVAPDISQATKHVCADVLVQRAAAERCRCMSEDVARWGVLERVVMAPRRADCRADGEWGSGEDLTDKLNDFK